MKMRVLWQLLICSVIGMLLFSSIATASNKEAENLAALSSSFLFELNQSGLENTLKHYLRDKSHVKTLKIVDSVDKTIFLSYRLKGDEQQFGKKLAENCSPHLSHFDAAILYDSDKIGQIQICMEQQQSPLQFSPEEQQWLSQNPLISVHNELEWAPFNFNKNGQAMGFSIDYMNLLAKKIGIKVDYISGEWNELLNHAMNKKLDVMLNIAKSKSREKYLLFTEPYTTNPSAILARKDDKTISDLESLNGKKVAVVNGFVHESVLIENFPLIERLPVANIIEAVKAVEVGKADATIGSHISLIHTMRELLISDLAIKQYIDTTVLGDTQLRLAIRNDQPLLHSILSKAMAKVSTEEIRAIQKRWALLESTDKKLALSPEQRQWIASNPVVKVGGQMDWAPFDFVNEIGEYDGLVKDYLDVISNMTGIKFEVQTGKTWEQILSEFKSGQIDLLPAFYYTEEREAYAYFSQSYFSLVDYFYTPKGANKISSIKSLYGKKLAVIKGYAIVEWLKSTHEQIELIEASSLLDALRLVESGQAEAFINDIPSTSYIIEKHFLSSIELNNIVPERAPTQVYMAANYQNKILIDIIKLAINNISRVDKRNIVSHWMSSVKNNRNIELSVDERSWLLKHRKLRFAVDPNWLPIEAINRENKQYEGMMSDLLGLITEQSGLEFELVPTQRWAQSVELIKQGKVDMLAAASKTPEREAYLNFSDKTIELNDGILMHSDAKFISEIDDLEGLRIGVSKDTSLHKNLKNNHPKLILVPTAGTVDGLKRLHQNKIDAFIGNLEVIGYQINQLGYFNFKVVLRLEQKRQLHIAIGKHIDPPALDIINKSIRVLPEKEFKAIRQRWIGLKVSEGVDFELLWKITLGVIAIILFIAYNNYRLQKLVTAKTRDIERQKTELKIFNRNLERMIEDRTKDLAESEAHIRAVMDSVEDVIITITPEGKIHSVNDAVEGMFGYQAEELIDENIKVLMGDKLGTLHQHYMHNKVLEDDNNVVGQGVIERKGVHKLGHSIPLDVTVGRVDNKRAPFFVGVLRDISERKEAENKLHEAFKELEQLHSLTRDSINYASLIQSALLPEQEQMEENFKDAFVIWEPKDIVGGDIFLFEELRHPNESLLFVIDCTGHGVPGAFVTMLVKAIERQLVSNIVNGEESVSPGKLLSQFNRTMKQLLKQESRDSISNAGFDGAIIYIDKDEMTLRFAGAETLLFYTEDGKMKKIKGNHHSVGYRTSDANFEFKEHQIAIKPGTSFYVSTDGYYDQLGGEKEFPFGKKRFIKVVEQCHDKPMAEQKGILMEALRDYQGELHQNDDVTMVGFKV